MKKPEVKSIEIKQIRQWFSYAADISICTTYLSIKGILRVTFGREFPGKAIIDDKGVTLPLKITREYRVDAGLVREFFETHDFTKLISNENDCRVLDGSIWKMKIRTSEGLIKLDGNMQPPEPFGDELKAFILTLVRYEEEPWLF